MQHSQPHITLYRAYIFLSWVIIIVCVVEALMMILFSSYIVSLSQPYYGRLYMLLCGSRINNTIYVCLCLIGIWSANHPFVMWLGNSTFWGGGYFYWLDSNQPQGVSWTLSDSGWPVIFPVKIMHAMMWGVISYMSKYKYFRKMTPTSNDK